MILVVGSLARLPQRGPGVEGGYVPTRNLVPHAVLNENMSRHVAGMGNGGSDVCILGRSLECYWRMDRVIEGMNNIVGCARMILIFFEELHRDSPGAHIDALAHVPGDRCPGQH